MPLPPASQVHVWSAWLEHDRWPDAGGLPAAERDRATAMLRSEARKRWVAARWALRSVLCRYLERDPTQIELRLGPHGKPALADPGEPLRFNLSHSAELALIAVAADREVGIDVERIGPRPPSFYADWTRWEASVKCAGVGLGGQLPAGPMEVRELDAGPRFAAALAVAGDSPPSVQRFAAEPAGRERRHPS